MSRIAITLIVPCIALACSSDPKRQAAAPSGANDDSSATAEKQNGAEGASAEETSQANVHISDRLKKACGITDSEAFFAYNSAAVSGSARGVLKKLADCFETGPMKGQKMLLVGHADPRGDEEYNLALGGKRADNVKRTLGTLGLKSAKVTTSSRGELDAKGQDEPSWAKDRRVDVTLDE